MQYQYQYQAAVTINMCTIVLGGVCRLNSVTHTHTQSRQSVTEAAAWSVFTGLWQREYRG